MPKYWNIRFFKICTGIQFPFRILKYFDNFSKIWAKQKCGMLMTNFITGKPNEQEGVLPFSKLMFSKSQVFWLIWCCFSMCISIIDLSLTQLAWVALTYNFVWPCQPTCKLIEWSSITCSQEKEREIKMKRSLSAKWWQIEECGGGQVRLVILMAYVLRKWK